MKNTTNVAEVFIRFAPVVLFLAAIAWLLRVVSGFIGLGPSARDKQAEKKSESDEIAASYGLDSSILLSDAQTLSHSLGTAYAWYDPRSWSEDEAAVLSVLLQYDIRTFPALERVYFVDASRSLRADLKKYLSPSQHSSIFYL